MKKMQPKISIIVPVYNTEKFLKQCLNSLMHQTLAEIEIICINDGSTDRSLEILKEYQTKDSRIIVINKENEGQSIARNIGISQAKGKYLGFVDSDDRVDLNYFEKLYNATEKYNCDIACAGIKRCGKLRQSIRKSYLREEVFTHIDDKVRIDKLPDHNYMCNKIFLRDKWLEKDISFAPGRYFEDLALVIQVLYKLDSMVVVPEIYYYYRKNNNSTVATKSAKHIEDLEWARNTMLDFAQNHNIKISYSNTFYKKESIKLFKITLLKIYYYENVIKYKLFGFIPVFKQKTKVD